MRAEFAANLALQRQRMGVSQRQAAADLQVSQALLSHYEKGIREPGLDFVVRAADYYGVTADELLGHVPHKVPPAPEAGRDAEQVLWDSLRLVLELERRNFDPDVYRYMVAYLGAVIYELVRHCSRMVAEQQEDWFQLSDESFDSGAVVSDLTWIRAKFILAVRQYIEKRGRIALSAPEQLQGLDSEWFHSLTKLVRMVEGRILCQELAEEQRRTDLASANLFSEEEDHP